MRQLQALVLATALLPISVAAPAVEPNDAFLQVIQIEQVTPGTWSGDTLGAADTICFGGHDGNGYAIEGGIWDFEDGTLQGMTGLSEEQGGAWWMRVEASDFECAGQAPMIEGTPGQLWIGGQQERADRECWVCDAGEECSLGYRNNLREQAESPLIAYGGGDVDVGFAYFTDSEGAPFDFTSVQIVAYGAGVEIGVVSLAELGGQLGSPGGPLNFVESVSSEDLPVGMDEIRIRFEFQSDGGWSDEDGFGGICTAYGPMGADDVTVRIGGAPVAEYDFNQDDEGWTFESLTVSETLVGVNELTDYDAPPADCGLEGFILEFHDDDFGHPPPEHFDGVVSPVMDMSAFPGHDFESIVVSYDVWGGETPAGKLIRARWMYYPWQCEASGVEEWSPIVGSSLWFYLDDVCTRFGRDAVPDGVPGDAEQYRVVLETHVDGPALDDPGPLFDNVQVCFVDTDASSAPEAADAGVLRLLHPNPFRPGTLIEFAVPAPGDVDLSIYDVTGRLVRTLVRGSVGAGSHQVAWDGRDAAGNAVTSGIFWSRLKSGQQVSQGRLIVIQ